MKFAKPVGQQGVSLIEVLVSMGLGVFFLLMATQYLVVGQESNRVQDSGSRIQENARFAMGILRNSVQQAGYVDPTLAKNPDFVYTGNCGDGSDCSDDEFGDNVGDRIAVSLVADSTINVDCVGASVTEETEFANIFFVEEVGGVRSLYCSSWDIETNSQISAQQPLVDGIEQIQVQYGVSDVEGGPIVSFMSASSISGDDWDLVRSVRIALLVESGLQTNESDRAGVSALQADSRTYALLDGPAWTISDDRLRRVYTSTIELNNSFE